MIIPPGSLPGMINFASNPTMNPMTIQDRMPIANLLGYSDFSPLPYHNPNTRSTVIIRRDRGDILPCEVLFESDISKYRFYNEL
jgi:hypothetical protein